ncbi:hypothetical protein NB712_000128 [Xanthomonas sacchari]|nr:hypothetical protein [Xanthomonas sacchari]
MSKSEAYFYVSALRARARNTGEAMTYHSRHLRQVIE